MQVLFIRHGEPSYQAVKNLQLVSYLAELTSDGVKQANAVSLDPRLKDAELIVSSPFTRALQTAAIISNKTRIPLTVDPLLHEWLEDTSHLFTVDDVYGKAAYHDFLEHNGTRHHDTIFDWEDISHVAKRAYSAMTNYHHMRYKKIIVVTHAMVIRTFGYTEQKIPYCTIFEKEFDENTRFNGFVPWKG